MTLDEVSKMAERYSTLWRGHRTLEVKADMLLIETIAVGFTAFEMAYFCQQTVSFFADASMASMCLTYLTNKINPES